MIDFETTLKTQVLQHTGEVFIVAVSRRDNKQVYRFKMRELSEQRAGAEASIYQKRLTQVQSLLNTEGGDSVRPNSEVFTQVSSDAMGSH